MLCTKLFDLFYFARAILIESAHGDVVEIAPNGRRISRFHHGFSGAQAERRDRLRPVPHPCGGAAARPALDPSDDLTRRRDIVL